MTKLARPVLTAITVCERIIRDKDTDRPWLIGIIERIHPREFPHRERLTFYVRLTEANDAREFRFELFDLADMKRLVHQESRGERRLDPMGTWGYSFDHEVKFTHPGEYEFSIAADGDKLGGHRFQVEEW